MEGASLNGGVKKEANKREKFSPDSIIPQYKGDPKKHYIFHCNGGIGAIFTGSEDQCRSYLMNNPSLVLTSIICDEDEYMKISKLNEAAIRGYFMRLRLQAKDYA